MEEQLILEYDKEDYSDENMKLRDEFQSYHKVRDSLRDFEIKCNLKLFKLLFERSGDRLWSHFTNDCGRDLQKFLTYLTEEQHTRLLINAHKNKTMYYPL